MAGQHLIRPDSLGSLIAEQRRQIEVLATTPSAGNQSIRDGALVVLGPAGNAEALVGQYTWPTAPWADTNIYGMVTFDGAGNPIVVVGLQPDGLYGMGVYDASGDRVVLLGQEGGGLYGLAILNEAGVVQRIGGSLYDFGAGMNTSSTTPTAMDAQVTCTVGSSGQALVTINAQITVDPNTEGFCELYIDGVATNEFVYAGSSFPADFGTTSGCSAQFTAYTTPGSHTFRLYGYVSGASVGNAALNPISLVVQPL